MLNYLKKRITDYYSNNSYKYFEIDLEEQESLDYAIKEIVDEGNAVPACLGEVYALIGDARNPKAISQVVNVKKRPSDKPFAVLLDAQIISLVVDLARIHPNYHYIFKDPDQINTIFGSKGFLRIPVVSTLGLEPSLIGPDNKIQVFTFHGDDHAYNLESELRDRLREKHHEGHGEILITSYNISGQPSITTAEEAKTLTITHKICLQINRKTTCGTGSYSIYEFDLKGVHKARSGTGEEEVDKILGIKADSISTLS